MHTTLAFLKEVQACIPGYTKMAAFFSTRPEIKDAPIPLFMVALVAGTGDCEWTAANGFTLDHKEFEGVYRENLWRMLRFQFWRHLTGSDYNGASLSAQRTREAAAEIEIMRSHEEAMDFLEKYNSLSLGGDMWNDFLGSATLYSPVHFVRALTANFELGYHPSHRKYRSEMGLLVDPKPEQPGDEETDEDYSANERRRARERREERARQRMADLDDNKRYFDVRSREPANYSMARALAGGRDPFVEAMRFVHEHDLPALLNLKGVMISQASDLEPPAFHMSLNLSDAEMMFRVLHLLRAQDFNINEMLNITETTNLVSTTLREHGIGGHSRSLERLHVNAEGEVEIVGSDSDSDS